VASDGGQWILQRRKGIDKRTGQEIWAHVSFVSSTKAILARCMREKGVPTEDAQRLLAGLLEAFGASGGSPTRADPRKSLPTPATGGPEAVNRLPDTLPQFLLPSTERYLAGLATIAAEIEGPHLTKAPPIVPAAELDDIPAFLVRG
jgi:hypothetical protein